MAVNEYCGCKYSVLWIVNPDSGLLQYEDNLELF